jgi:hypothetical protein
MPGRIFARGTAGVQLTTTETGNTLDGGDIPFTVVSPSNSASITYQTGNDLTEDTLIRYAATTGVYETRKTITGTAPVRGSWQLVFKLSALPSLTTVTGQVRNNTTGSAIEMRISSGNAVALNANGTTFDTASTALVADGRVYVWDVWFETGTTTSNGKGKHRLRTINSDGTFTAVHTGTLFTDKNTGVAGTNDPNSWRWGKITSASTIGLDALQYYYGDGDTDYAPNPQTGVCGSDQTQEPWSTAALHAKGFGVWSQLSGTAVTLGGSGKDRTYSVPRSMSSQTLQFGYGGDSCTNTVLPVTDSLRLSGVNTPIRYRTGAQLRIEGII